MSNGCGGEGGFKFSIIRDWIKRLPLVNPVKLNKLYYDIEIKACNPHDDKYEEGGGIIKFIKANYIFALDVTYLLHWTTIPGRAGMFILLFGGTTIFGIKYFNWKI